MLRYQRPTRRPAREIIQPSHSCILAQICTWSQHDQAVDWEDPWRQHSSLSIKRKYNCELALLSIHVWYRSSISHYWSISIIALPPMVSTLNTLRRCAILSIEVGKVEETWVELPWWKEERLSNQNDVHTKSTVKRFQQFEDLHWASGWAPLGESGQVSKHYSSILELFGDGSGSPISLLFTTCECVHLGIACPLLVPVLLSLFFTLFLDFVSHLGRKQRRHNCNSCDDRTALEQIILIAWSENT